MKQLAAIVVGFLVAASVGLLAQPSVERSKRPGKIVFDGGRERPFVQAPLQYYYFPSNELSDFIGYFSTTSNPQSRMARVRVDDVEEIAFLPITEAQMALIKTREGKGIGLTDKSSTWRRASIRTKTRTMNDVFVDVNYTGNLQGPDGQDYRLGELDIIKVIR